MQPLPTITGQVPYDVERAIRMLHVDGQALEGAVAAARAAIPPPVSAAAIRNALGATGVAPLNIFQLLGGPVTAGGAIRVGTHAQRLTLPPASAGSGTLWYETDRLALYYVAAATLAWTLAGSWGMSGTLNPNQKPTDLGTVDTEFLFHASDFERLYRWTGAAWVDAPNAPGRSIAWFPYSLDAAFQPGTGYQLCDGTANVRVSKSDGTTVLVTVPDLTTANRFLRSVAGATGGTGGSATTHTHQVDPPNTTSTTESAGHTHPVDPPSTTSGNDSGAGTVVAAGVGTTVATHTHTHATDIASFTSGAESNTHTHDVDIAVFASAGPSGAAGDDALPPYYNARPYLRL